MEVALVLGRILKREANFEQHPAPKVAFENGQDSLVIAYKWRAECNTHTALKDPTDMEIDKKREEMAWLGLGW